MGRHVSINSHVALALSQAPLLLRGSWRGPKPSQVHALDSGTLDICIHNASLPYAFARRLLCVSVCWSRACVCGAACALVCAG